MRPRPHALDSPPWCVGRYLALQLQLTHALMSQKQHEELDCDAAISALQWAAATVACTRSGYPKVCPRLNLVERNDLTVSPSEQPSDIAVPPVIRKLQMQSAALAAAAAASIPANVGREEDGGAGDRRPRPPLYSPR